MNRCMTTCLIVVLISFNAAALESQNKVPQQYCVEGSVAQNMVNGSVTLDGKGEALIVLPRDFDAVNNPRYFLTPVGAAMPNLHVMQKIHDNRFWIAGGAAAGEVSWMIIAESNDPEVAGQDAGADMDASKK